VQWRKDKVQELCSKWYSQRDVSSAANMTGYNLRNQAQTNIKKYIDERLPGEYEKCLVGLNAITKEA
jgi:hypothetical protein